MATTITVEPFTKARLRCHMPQARSYDEALNRILDEREEEVSESEKRLILHRLSTFDGVDARELAHRFEVLRRARARVRRRA